MKAIQPILLLAAITLMAGCNGKETKPEPTGDPQVQTTANGTRRLQNSHATGKVQWRNATFSYDIKRMADDSIPAVKDENGARFADNHIELVVSKDGQPFFSRTFTKRSFAEYIDSDFLANGILEGLVFDKAEPDGLHFAASVSYPQSDMFVPLVVTIASNGGLNIRKDTDLDGNGDTNTNDSTSISANDL